MKLFRILYLTFSLCFFILSLEAQEIKFKVYGFNPCSNSYEKVDVFTLKGENETLMPMDSTGIVTVNSFGEYFLHTDIGLVSHFLSEEKTYVDTVSIASIYLCHDGSTKLSFVGYCCCDERCNDYQIDYYTNGIKRIEGFFKDGQPIGKIYFYHPNGNLKLVKKCTKNGSGLVIKEISYDEQGNKLDVIRYGKWYYFLIRLFRK